MMPEAATHALADHQLSVLRQILSDFADHVDLVGLFGSRAIGKARANSDIDLVLYGRIDESQLDRIWTLFHESVLAVEVDVKAYDLITHAPLKAHIDDVMRPLFTREELRKES